MRVPSAASTISKGCFSMLRNQSMTWVLMRSKYSLEGGSERKVEEWRGRVRKREEGRGRSTKGQEGRETEREVEEGKRRERKGEEGRGTYIGGQWGRRIECRQKRRVKEEEAD